MKSLLLFSTIIATVFGFYVGPGEITSENFDKFGSYFANNSRIANGVAGRRGENLDFCYLSVRFQNKYQSCGCVVVDTQWVLTSARCVVDNSEGRATSVIVTFPQVHGSNAVRQINSFLVPAADNGLGTDGAVTLAAYDPAADIPFTTIGPSNVAMIKLLDPLTLGRNYYNPKKATRTAFADFAAFKAGTINMKYRACGIGVINNQGDKSNGVMCVDMNPISVADCKKTDGAVVPMPEDGTAICLKWDDRENNVCMGDWGGPVWAYETDTSGRLTSSQLFCVTVGSPNVRQGAPCLDAHKVVCMFLPGKVNAWITNVLAGR